MVGLLGERVEVRGSKGGSRTFYVDLRLLIISLALASAIFAMVNGFHASYKVQRQQLIDNTLESNHAYATKLAASTENFIHSAVQQLQYSAARLAKRFSDDAMLFDESERIRLQTDSFNSVAVVDGQGIVRATSPNSLALVGRQLDSPGAVAALRERRPLISQPYVSAAGNLIVFISTPVFDAAGNYLGYVGGSIYLKQKSILNSLLGEHYYRDGSYLYVVDDQRRLLYHQDGDRVGTQVGANPVIDAVLRRESGQMRLHNSQGVDMLAGYAIVPSTGWGVVAQRPTLATLAALDVLMESVVLNTLPLAVIIVLFIWVFARLISRPLRQLAEGARGIDRPDSAGQIQRIRSWYFESSELKRALLIGIGLINRNISKLRQDAQVDPLTGLNNRRGMEIALSAWTAERQPFAIVALDIDHFKNVNDTYGHDVGDEVLKLLAGVMRANSREGDVLCRMGGEEFVVLLPGAELDVARQVAERLRRGVEQAAMEPVGHITVSLGVARWPEHGGDVGQALKVADEMLYEAKRSGRNRVVAAQGTADRKAGPVETIGI